MNLLYQDDPQVVSTFTLNGCKNRSLTDSLESYQNRAYKETMILRFNNRIPTKEIVLHFLTVFTKKEIQSIRTKIFLYLTRHKLIAVASIELTRGENGNPNNTIHFHLLTDDPRSEEELREIVNKACTRAGLVNKRIDNDYKFIDNVIDIDRDNDYRIDYRKLYDGFGYYNYFTKYGYFHEVILFQKGEDNKRAIQKFYEIGKGKWFYKSKELIWEDVKAYLQAKFNTDIEENETPDYYEEFLGYADQTYSDIEIPCDISQESIDRINEKYKSGQDKLLETEIVVEESGKEKVSDWFGCPLDYHLPQKNILPQKQIRDKRYEWDRYRYSIAFLN